MVALDKYCDDIAKQASENASNLPSSEIMMTPGDLVAALGKKVQGINLLEIEAYIRSSKIARKISGYSEKLAVKEAAGKHTLITITHALIDPQRPVTRTLGDLETIHPYMLFRASLLLS